MTSDFQNHQNYSIQNLSNASVQKVPLSYPYTYQPIHCFSIFQKFLKNHYNSEFVQLEYWDCHNFWHKKGFNYLNESKIIAFKDE